ncbi:uncharacterized protein LOC143586338 [Bidens hawaiensis]|uniref:uncharacterized protein LOC143586338 n=1 Tax=Bidens hawaiensis TaxID=980011 RepID=UPI00404924DC
MLLRSSSNPALNSWLQHQQNPILLPSSPEPDFIRYKSSHDSPKMISRASSESDLTTLSSLSKQRRISNSLSCCTNMFTYVAVEEDVEAEEKELLFSSSGLDPGVVDGGGNNGHGRICGGGGGGNCNGSDDTDLYYQSMIEMDPSNSLVLVNYAKYLKEVRGDAMKAEEYCGRAILANPNDGTALSMYADLIWEMQKDASRARSYFDQAVKASPDDCYIMASYARFLWDAEEDDDEEEEQVSDLNQATTSFSQQFPVAPMAAASWG